MLKRYQHIVGGVFRVVDGMIVGLVWLLSYWLRFHISLFPVTKGFPSFETYAAMLPVVIFLWSFVFSSMGVYRSQRMLRRTHEAQLILKAHGVSILIFIALTYLISEYRYSRIVVIYFGTLGGILLVLFRLVLRNGLRSIRKKGFNLRHVLMVGEGVGLENIIYKIGKFPELGFRVIGEVTLAQNENQRSHSVPHLGTFEDIQKVVTQYRPDQIVISLPRSQYGELDKLLGKLKDETAEIQLIPDIHEYVTLGCEVEEFDGIPIVNLNDSPLSGWGSILKRLTDIVISAVSLVVLSPILLLIALFVKLSSKGPILYTQERMGLDGRVFKMLKFRSMPLNAEERTGAVWAKKDDPRRTTVGKILRSTSLDELPQLWNILLGDMSLVGPRPERPVFVSQFRDEIPNYMLRHKVKAGLTGWAQVNGWRGDTSLHHRIECDLYYIRNWSYVLDIKIIFMTLWRGLINKNAY